MDKLAEDRYFARFDINETVRSLPARSETLLTDTYLTHQPSASARVFRFYRPTPPHYLVHSDEYLYVLSGNGTFWMGSPANAGAFAPGTLLFFKRGTVHALPELTQEPAVFLSVDTPRRDPKDIVFVNPEDGTPESFIQARRQ